MKKNIQLAFAVIAAAGILSGCNVEMAQLTEEESELVVEYATNLIVKHSAISNRDLLTGNQLETGILKETEEEERQKKAQEIAESYLNQDSVKSTENTITEEATANKEPAAAPKTVSEFYGMDQIAIDYASYQICQSYPETDSEDIFMAMDATSGHQLCVVTFQVRNLSAQEQEVDTLSKHTRFWLQPSGGVKLQAQATMLLNDLSSYKGVLAGGESKELVLVFEVEEGAEQMEGMQLIMKDAEGENTIFLN